MQVLSPDLARVQSALDALPIGEDPNFRGVVESGKLRHTSTDGRLDAVDRLTARLLCSALKGGRSAQVLVVLPDDGPRRCPLLFASSLITDALAHLGSGVAGHQVLYVSQDSNLRTQLNSVRLGSLNLDGVFAQQYGRGRAEALRSVSTGGLRLPSVLCVQGPADAAALVRQHRPKWIAVDCGDGSDLPWLSALLTEARRSNVPVVGWARTPFGSPVHEWSRCGGGIFRWPRRRRTATASVERVTQLAGETLTTEIAVRVLDGVNVEECSRAFAAAAEALLAARQIPAGRLAADAVSIGWRCLRTMETLPVPLDVFEREASSYWGVRRIGELYAAFEKFTTLLVNTTLRAHLQEALDALADARARLAAEDPPLWLGLANLCVDSEHPREILFSTRSRLKMFCHSLLAQFDVSEDDLRGVGVSLRHLASEADDDGTSMGAASERVLRRNARPPLLVGLPGRDASRYLEPFYQSERPEVLIWPHQDEVLQRRLRLVSADLSLAAERLGEVLPSLEGIGGGASDARSTLRASGARQAAVCRPRARPAGGSTGAPLWRRPDAAQAIASLFGGTAAADEEEEGSMAPVVDEPGIESVPSAGEDAWVQSAIEIQVDKGRRILLPVDERVNVIVHGTGGAEVEQRYVRSLVAGNEILFIQGQRRQSLYGLLVSRVHRDPVIAQYLALVQRWQDDFTRSFAAAERSGKMSADQMLSDLQARGSAIRTSSTIRAWVRGHVLAPSDAEDIRRIAEVLSLPFVLQYYLQIHRARGRLWGLHIQLSAKLNRWLDSSEVGSAADSVEDNVIDTQLGLTVEDFRHSLLRLRIVGVTTRQGPFYRPHLGQLEQELA